MKRIFVLGLVFISFVSLGFGQNYDRIAPRVLPAEKKDIKIPKKEDVDVKESNEIVLEKLRGVVFVAKDKKLKKKQDEYGGVWTIGLNFTKEQNQKLADRIKKYMGKPVSLKILKEIGNILVVIYREKGQPVVNVVLTKQDITSGVVQFVVVEGKLGKVKAEGNKWFDSKLLTDQIKMKKGETIRSKPLKEDLNWLNDNSFRSVEAAFTPGKDSGETDIILKTKDRFPVRFYSGYEDTGGDSTGDERWIAGFNWGNAFFMDHQLGYQFTTSSDFESSLSHAGNYTIPLPWRHKWSALGSFTTSKSQAGGGLFNSKGESWMAGTRYTIPFSDIEMQSPFKKYTSEMSLGFDFKRSNNNLDFGGESIFDNETDILQFLGKYEGNLEDKLGRTSFDGGVYVSPGGLTSGNKDSIFDQARADAKARYVYVKGKVSRVTQLPFDFSLHNKLTGQYSNQNLLSSEQLGFGGYDTVRGYDESAQTGDSGWLFNVELRTPPVAPLKSLGVDGINDNLQFLGFWDYGTALMHKVSDGQNDNIELSSVGPGFRYMITPYLSIRADYGFQLIDIGDSRHRSRGHIGVTFSF